MLKFALPPMRNIKFVLPPMQKSQHKPMEYKLHWVPNANFLLGHVHFMLFVLISFVVGNQREPSLQWNMGFRPTCPLWHETFELWDTSTRITLQILYSLYLRRPLPQVPFSDISDRGSFQFSYHQRAKCAPLFLRNTHHNTFPLWEIETKLFSSIYPTCVHMACQKKLFCLTQPFRSLRSQSSSH